MSADATGWVYRHSPFRGATFQIHHAIADSVNDQHRNELWMALGTLAEKARTTRLTARRAVTELVESGFLVVLEEHQHKPSRYRFVYQEDASVVYESRWTDRREGGHPVTTSAEAGGHSVTTEVVTQDREVVTGDTSGGYSVTTNPKEPKQRTQKEPKLVATSSRNGGRGTRLAEPFTVTAAMREWADETCPHLDWREQTRRFCDYWRAQPGQRGVKLDWVATWRNWMRRAGDDLARSNGRSKSTRQGDVIRDAWQRAKELEDAQ